MFNFRKNGFRILARFCDYCLGFLGLGLISLFLPFFYGPHFYYFLALAVPLLWVPIEAVLISRWGSTPGKALFGISIRNAAGEKLKFKESLKRALAPWKSQSIVEKTPLSWKRKVLALTASGIFLLAGIYGNVLALWSMGFDKGIATCEWVEYSSTDVGFKVAFPTDPEQTSKQLVIPDSGKVLNYEEFKSDEKGKISYSLSHMQLPGKWRLAANTTLLKGALNAMVDYVPNAELIDKDFIITHQGLRALDYRMKVGKEEVSGRLIVVGKMLYHLTISYPPSCAEQIQNSPFLDSFEAV